MRSLYSIFAVSILVLFSFSAFTAPVSAHSAKPLANELSRKDIGALRKLLEGEDSSPEISAFKAPAEGRMVTICRFENRKLNCYPELTNLTCPTSILVETADGRGEFVDVNCTGPDADGQCDCEFVQ